MLRRNLEALESRDVPASFSALTGGAGELSRVVILDTAAGTPVADFLVFGTTFRGGVNAAFADVNLDGQEDLIVGAGRGGGPRVRIIDGRAFDAASRFAQAPDDLSPIGSELLIADFFAFEAGQRGGTFVTGGNIAGTGNEEVVIGAGVGGGPRVRIFDGLAITTNNRNFTGNAAGNVVADFFAFDPASRTGAVVALNNVRLGSFGTATDPANPFLAVSSGPGGDSLIRVFDPRRIANDGARFNPGNIITEFFAEPRTVNGGAFVTTVDFNHDGFGDLAVLSSGRVTVYNGVALVFPLFGRFDGTRASDVLDRFDIPRGTLPGGAFSNFDAPFPDGFGGFNTFSGFAGFNNLFGQPPLPVPVRIGLGMSEPGRNGKFVG